MAAGLLFVLLAVVTCGSSIRHAFEIGADEHYEVMKGLLWARGYPLYTRVWNDQPPLLTVLLGLAFKLFGPQIVVARALAVFFGALLVGGLFHFARRASGPLAASVAAFCLVAAPEVFKLTISAMLEVPAIAVGLWALWPIQRWAEDRRPRWPVCSGLIMATALQAKLTAAILGPALAAEILLISLGPCRASPPVPPLGRARTPCAPEDGGCGSADPTMSGSTPTWRGGLRSALGSLLVWLGAAVGGFILLGVVFGSGYRQAWESHFSGKTPQALAESGQLAFSPALLLDHTEALWGLGAALVVLIWKRSLRRPAFPLALLATAAAIHLLHRPYWPYYYLHFAVPIAWLTGLATAELGKAAWAGLTAGLAGPAGRAGPETASCGDRKPSAGWPWRPWLVGMAAWAAAGCVMAVLGSYGASRLLWEIGLVRAQPRIEDDALLAAMKRYAPRTRWAYAENTMYAFHARLCVIPELAVMPRKRWWSGHITQDHIVALVKQYRPEQMLLPAQGTLESQICQSMGADYTVACEGSAYRLFVAKPVPDL